jgi:CTP-dependent riboflavin kinase
MDSNGESLRKKMTGKPYSGKLNVRFDEGELEIGLKPLRQFPTLPNR